MATSITLAGELITPYNYTAGTVSRIKYIVIHFVGALGGAKDNCTYFATGYRGASAHYYVGFNGEIWRSVRDQDIAWAVGGMAYVHPECRNSNSISIEMCVRKSNTSSLSSTDKDWYFEKATVENTIKLTKYLMEKYNIDADHVIRHYDVNHKICPNPYVYNHTDYTWDAFKAALTGNGSVTVKEVTAETWKKTGTATCTGQDVRVRSVANGPVIGYLGKGDTVEIDGTTSGSWTHVKATCGVGWVYSTYLKENTTTTNTTTTSSSTATKYYVKSGDTLTKIAKAYNTTVDALVKANNIANASLISVGQTIIIPAGTSTTTTSSTTKTNNTALIKAAQTHLNNFCNAGLTVNGEYNNETKKAVIKALQAALNKAKKAGLDEDGINGTLTKKAYNSIYLKKGTTSYIITFVEIALMAKGYNPNGVECPGVYGSGLLTAIKSFKANNSLTVNEVINSAFITALVK